MVGAVSGASGAGASGAGAGASGAALEAIGCTAVNVSNIVDSSGGSGATIIFSFGRGALNLGGPMSLYSSVTSSTPKICNAKRDASCSATRLFREVAVTNTVPSGFKTPIVKVRSCNGPTIATSLYLGGW